MKALKFLDDADAKRIRGVFCDIDDTLTTEGKLTADAYLALWRLKAAGLAVVPVTGRPAGWCDQIARQWPVDAVIGENGALAFFEVEGRLHHLFHPEVPDPDEARALLDGVRDAVLAAVPGSRLSKDQPYRLFDLAVDFREELPDLGFDAADRIKSVFEAAGATAKVSSIHVNGWFGAYDKLSMARYFCAEVWKFDLAEEKENFVFVGDSPNDAPMFGFFPSSCGVANVREFEGRLEAEPAFVSDAPGGAGFAEIANRLIVARAS